MSLIHFRCPTCEAAVPGGSEACPSCRHELVGESGVPDFVRRPELVGERAHYDAVYKEKKLPPARPLSEAVDRWKRPNKQVDFGLIRDALPDLEGARVLVVGNGSSAKELAFLEWGVGALVFSDLSAWGVAANLAGFDLSEVSDRLFPAAIDAEDLPFEDGTFDLVYGFAMVHHLPNVDAFLAEARRVLKPGGKAVFFDDAYAPVWQWSKRTVLRPLMAYSHWKTGISPEDYRFTMEGGFRTSDLAQSIEAIGGTPWFSRAAFGSYVWRRGVQKLVPGTFGVRLVNSRLTGTVERWDARLGDRFGWWRANQIRLAWGFTVSEQSV